MSPHCAWSETGQSRLPGRHYPRARHRGPRL